MSAKSKRAARSGSEDSGDVSESTRAVRRIQRQLEADDKAPPPKKSKDDNGNSRGKKPDKPMGDGRKYGAITGVKLDGLGAPANSRAGGLAVAGKGGSEKAMGMNLESLVSMEDENRWAPEAPSGSFRRRDMEAVQDAGGTSTSQKGIDGKVYNFVSAPSDDESEDTKEQRAMQRQKVAQALAKESAEEGKDKSKKAKKKEDKKKDKKKKKKEKEKKKKAKKKKKKSSSSSDSSSSS